MLYATLLHTATELPLAGITYSKYVILSIGRTVSTTIVVELLWASALGSYYDVVFLMHAGHVLLHGWHGGAP